MSTSKIKIKLGAIEIEYEGSESFLKEELPQLLGAVSELYQKSHGNLPVSYDEPMSISNDETRKEKGSSNIQATIGALAARLQVKSGPDLVIAAAAKLTFVDGMELISSAKLLDEIKLARSYYKTSYSRNFTRTVGQLVKAGRLNEPSKNNYVLTAKELASLEPRIAE